MERATAGPQDGRSGLCGAGGARNDSRDAKKNELKPWLKEQWCIPPKKNAELVYHMEDILDVYHRLYDARYPQVCMMKEASNCSLTSASGSR